MTPSHFLIPRERWMEEWMSWWMDKSMDRYIFTFKVRQNIRVIFLLSTLCLVLKGSPSGETFLEYLVQLLLIYIKVVRKGRCKKRTG